MLGNLKVRLVSALERAGETQKINSLAALLARYICRLIGAREFRKQLRLLLNGLEDLQREVLCLKEDLDYSILKNRLFRAIHTLANYKKVTKKRVLACSAQYSVECDDVFFLFRSLTRDDVKLVATKEIRDHEYSEAEIMQILGKVDRLMKGLAHKKLNFVLANDPMVERLEDLVGPLHVSAMKVIRDSEILNITPEHMLGKVIRTIRNQVVNLTAMHGRGKRQVVSRVKAQLDSRDVYYLNIQDGSIRMVTTFAGVEYRVKRGGNIHICVMDTKTDEWLIVHHKRLYETEKEAQGAWEAKQKGLPSKRRYYIDPSPMDIDDYQLNVVSIEAADETNTRHNYLDKLTAAAPTAGPDAAHAQQMVDNLPPRLQEFAELVFNVAVNELFDAWCAERGINPTMCDTVQTGRVARRYLGLSKNQLKHDLLESSASLWEAGNQEFIADNTLQ